MKTKTKTDILRSKSDYICFPYLDPRDEKK